MTQETRRFGRRALLVGGAAATASLTLGAGAMRGALAQEPQNQTVEPGDRKLLFVFCAHGGASIINGLLPVVDSEVGDTALADTLDVYPESLVGQVAGSAFRYTKALAASEYSFMSTPPEMEGFIGRHGNDIAVFCHGVSSVNHNIAQARALNGAGANAGRTLMEAMAIRYGGGMPLPSCNMAQDGFVEDGTDKTVPAAARHEIITAPRLFATGTHGFSGIAGLPKPGSIERARKVREQLDQETVFAKTFGKSPLISRYLDQRATSIKELEQADLIEKLVLTDPAVAGSGAPGQAALVADLNARLPLIAVHDIQAQLGLAFLLAYHGASTSITFGFHSDPVIVDGEGVITAPIAFDYSHSVHRATQSVMWGNLGALLDTLIGLLKDHDYLGDPTLGKMWDRSLIYVATDFGRTKTRPSGSVGWGSGHDLNNGSVIISPMIRGNQVYGGVDPKTCLTYGFDRQSGEPDRGVVFEEAALYGALAHALDIDFPGRQDCPVLVRG